MKSLILLVLLIPYLLAARSKKQPAASISELDKYIEAMEHRSAANEGYAASPGSVYGNASRMSNLVRDQRAYQIDDIVTITVNDKASAVAKGVTSTSRKTSSKKAITALAGPLSGVGALANLGNLSGTSTLDGQGETSRETQLSTALSARVVHVLPNGFLILQGTKEISVNSERQTVVVKGVCRPQDLSQNNVITSDRLAQLEVRVNGKGVVGDAVRRPFILYRILEGLLPF
ncbi:MAG: flagellar basal body L-ring protein FlgH [Acidobacteria bacterium]|nr:flagellar basal body L-ring protein FlgH [Acidobacteriota bacterium]